MQLERHPNTCRVVLNSVIVLLMILKGAMLLCWQPVALIGNYHINLLTQGLSPPFFLHRWRLPSRWECHHQPRNVHPAFISLCRASRLRAAASPGILCLPAPSKGAFPNKERPTTGPLTTGQGEAVPRGSRKCSAAPGPWQSPGAAQGWGWVCPHSWGWV